MPNTLVSIIIPVYNVEKYLNQCFDSVISQSYEKIEILLIDDGSTDGSDKLCDYLAETDKRAKTYHKVNGGLSSARNYGMDRANGNYIYFLDSDDYIENGTIETLVTLAETKNLEMVPFSGKCFWDNKVDELTRKQFEKTYAKTEDSEEVCSGPQMYISLKSRNEYYPAVPMHFYKLDFLRENELRFQEGIIHEDELFSVFAYFFADRVGCCNERLYWRRMRENSIMSTKATVKNVRSCKVILDQIEGMITSSQYKEKDNKYKMIRLAYAHCLWLYMLRYNMLSAKEKKSEKEDYNITLGNIKQNDYFDSKEIRDCLKRKLLIPLRNNNAIHQIYKALKNK